MCAGFFGGAGMPGFGFFFMLVFWAALIWALFLLIRSLLNESGRRESGASLGQSSRKDSAMEILRERYAKGELSKEDFEKMKKDLS